MKRCKRCILPETYPDMKFNQQGICNKCIEYDQKWAKRDFEKLKIDMENMFNWAKKQNRRYDCLVPFSGGKDSTYTLFVCRKVYGLKTLAVNFNNGFRTQEAIKNIEKTIKKLDVAYMCYGHNWGLMKKLYREFFLKTGQFCFPCDMGIWSTIHRIAEKEDIPLIVSGFSMQIESRGAKIYSYNQNLFKNVTQGKISKEECKNFLPMDVYEKILNRLKRFRLTRYRKQISLPEYMNWDDHVIKDTIKNELQWDQGSVSTGDHIDCLFAPVKNYLVVQKWGFGEKTTKYSAMVRAGQMTREDALSKAAEEETRDISSSLSLFLDMLELSDKDIKDARMKSHLDYL